MCYRRLVTGFDGRQHGRAGLLSVQARVPVRIVHLAVASPGIEGGGGGGGWTSWRGRGDNGAVIVYFDDRGECGLADGGERRGRGGERSGGHGRSGSVLRRKVELVWGRRPIP